VSLSQPGPKWSIGFLLVRIARDPCAGEEDVRALPFRRARILLGHLFSAVGSLNKTKPRADARGLVCVDLRSWTLVVDPRGQ